MRTIIAKKIILYALYMLLFIILPLTGISVIGIYAMLTTTAPYATPLFKLVITGLWFVSVAVGVAAFRKRCVVQNQFLTVFIMIVAAWMVAFLGLVAFGPI